MVNSAYNENIIHHTSVVHQDARIGKANYIGPFCNIGPQVKIGDNNRFESYVSIGMPGEKLGYLDKFGPVHIGANNVFREFSVVNCGTEFTTIIKDHCLFMHNSHVAHDCLVEDGVIMSVGSTLGGESHAMKYANLGLGCSIHQHQVVGSYSIIGMNSAVPKPLDVIPGWVFVGNPARKLRVNNISLERNKVTDYMLTEESKRFWHIRNLKK